MTTQGKSPRRTLGALKCAAGYAAMSQLRWSRVGVVPIALVLLACAFISIISLQVPDAALQAGPRDSPAPRQTEQNNNRVAALGWVPDIDGIAIRYPDNVNRLVTPDGAFRTDLTLEQMADLLRIDPRSISQQGFPGQLNSSATLFKVVIGRLTEQSKALLRAQSHARHAGSQYADVVDYKFTQEQLCFTLSCLKDPDRNKKMILAAISRAAREIMPAPGDKARAIDISPPSQIEVGSVDFDLGYLPVVEDTAGPGAETALP